MRAPAVIDCATKHENIVDAVRQALSPDMRVRAARKETPYGRGDSARLIVEALKSADTASLPRKTFHDIHPEVTA